MTSDFLPQAVLFDFNGVIADDEQVHFEANAEVLWARGYRLEAEDYFLRYLGMNDRQFFMSFFEDHCQPLRVIARDELVQEKARAYSRRLPSVRLISGAVEAILDISRHVPVAVVSGALRSEIVAILGRHGLLGAASAIVSSEDVLESKPDPAAYLLGLELLGNLPPSRCLAIEDAPAGIRAARSARLHCWAVSSSRPPTELAEASVVLSSLDGVRYGGLWLKPRPGGLGLRPLSFDVSLTEALGQTKMAMSSAAEGNERFKGPSLKRG